MPKGVPYRVQVEGRGSRTYTFTEIAHGTGLSLALVSRVLRQQWPMSLYFQGRLKTFFAVPDGESCTINVSTPPARPLGRIVARFHRGAANRPPSLESALRELQTMKPFSFTPPTSKPQDR